MIRQVNTLLVVLVSFLVAYWLRFGNMPVLQGYTVALLVTLLLSSIVFPASGAFRVEFEWAVMRRLRRLIAAWAIVVLTLVSLAAMLKITDYFSRIWFGSWVLICGFGLIAVLLASHAAAISKRKRGKNKRKIVLVGSGRIASEVERQIRTDSLSGMELSACFGKAWSEQEVLPLNELVEYIGKNGVQEIWIAVPWEDKQLFEQSLFELKETVVDINVVPDLYQYRLLNQSISEWSGLPVISLSGTPMTGAELKLKGRYGLVGCFSDYFASFAAAVADYIDHPGGGRRPVIYRQQRHGIGGESIEILKFRTMKVTLEGAGFRQAQPDDDRVTWPGRFLRKTSLDELPQLFNVLKGEMSLVGPRPQPLELNDDYQVPHPQIHATPQGKTRHYRVGPGQWIPRAN